MRATAIAQRVVGIFMGLLLFSSCTTTDVASGVKADKTPAPKAAKSEMDIEPLNETDTVTALLPPFAKLKPDTAEAVQHDTKASKIPYIGVWAADDAGCGKIDQDAYDSFAVITPKSLRQSGEVCTIKAVPPQDNPTTIQANCGSSATEVTLLVTAIGGLQIVRSTGNAPVEYVRCQMPK